MGRGTAFKYVEALSLSLFCGNTSPYHQKNKFPKFYYKKGNYFNLQTAPKKDNLKTPQ